MNNASLEISGVAASRGSHTGRARVITSPSDLGRLGRGDVLVCPSIPPSWAMLFRRAGAVVADRGGILSNAATLAREFAIPAIVATEVATAEIRDGDIVTVDGDLGVVRVRVPALARS